MPTTETPRVDAIFGCDTAVELQDLLEKIAHEFWFNKLARIVATSTGCYEAATAMPRLEKMEAFLEIIQEQRALHLRRHPEMAADSVFGEPDMKEIHETWMKDYESWMNAAKLRAYEEQLASQKRGAQQRAHQMRRSAFSAYLFQVLGNRHILLACIQHPICSAVQPVSPTHRAAQTVPSSIAGFMKAWEKEKGSAEYQKRREISEKKTAERLKLKKAAHAARQNLARARKIARAIETGGRHLGGLWQWEKTLLEDLNSGKLAQVVDECDAAFGWNQQMRDKAGTAAGRLCPRGSSKTAVLHSPRHPATAANSASESSGPVESNASAAQPGPSTKRERSTDGHASAAQPGFAAISSSSTGVI